MNEEAGLRTGGMIDVKIKLLRYFVAVASESSMLRAAAKLNISQPSLSQRIHHLEDELGIALFARVQGRLELTEEGRTLLPAAHHLIAQAHRMQHVIDDLRQGRANRLAIGRHAMLEFKLIDNEIDSYIKKHPALEVIVTRKVYSPELLEGLRNGEIDVAFVFHPFSIAEFEYIPIDQFEFCLLAPKDRVQGSGEKMPLKALRGCEIASFRREANPGLYDRISSVIEGAGATLVAPPDSHLSAVGHYARAHNISALSIRELNTSEIEGMAWFSLEDQPLWLECSMVRPRGYARPIAISFWRHIEHSLSRPAQRSRGIGQRLEVA